MSTSSASAAASDRDAAAAHDERIEAVRQLEGTFAGMFSRLRRAYAEASASVSPGLQPGTFKTFTVIDRRGPITLSALAERLEADKGMLSRAVSELEGLGLVERTVDPTDGRIRLITVTADGHARLEAARVPYFDRLDDVLTDWPVDSIRQLSRLLEALTSGLAL